MNAHSLLLFTLQASTILASVLVRRESQLKCDNLQAKSNDGDRKIGIVIDSSGSMLDYDPYNYRLQAGKQINDWLISSSEASADKKADQVTLVDFDGSAHLVYPLGDPADLTSQDFNKIDSDGDTYIASGVRMATSQINGSSDTTAQRSGIVVLTDGEDSYTGELVRAINSATQQGIRISFGYLSLTGAYQDPDVLAAILQSGGTYLSISNAKAQQQFINYVLAHGLTDNDNDAPDTSTLVNGLSVSGFLDSSGAKTFTYGADSGEKIDFTITVLNTGDWTVKVTSSGGKTLDSDTGYSGGSAYLYNIKAPGGDLSVSIEAQDPQDNAIFMVGVASSKKITNCTLTDSGNQSGLSTGGKAGLGVGIPALVALLSAGGYYLWKKYGNPFAKSPAGPSGGEHAPHNTDFPEKGPTVNTEPVSSPSSQPPQYFPPDHNAMQPLQQPFQQPTGVEPHYHSPMNTQPPFHPHDPTNTIPPHMGDPSNTLPPHMGDPSNTVPPQMGDPSNTIPPQMGDPSNTVPPQIGDPSNTVPPQMGDPSNTVPPNMGDPSNTVPPADCPGKPSGIQPPPTQANGEDWFLVGAGRRRSSSERRRQQPPAPASPTFSFVPTPVASPPPQSIISSNVSELPSLQHQQHSEVPGSTHHREHVQVLDSAQVHEAPNTGVIPEVSGQPNSRAELPSQQRRNVRASDGHQYSLYEGV